MAAKVKTTVYYFNALILREGKRVPRQGTINALNEFEALDMVHEMVKRWNRPLVEVDLYEVVEGGELDLVLQSKIGALPSNNKTESRPKEKELVGDNDSDALDYGQPYDNAYSNYYQTKEFWPSSIGSYFSAETTFAVLKLPLEGR